MKWKTVKIESFLEERTTRFTPAAANKLELLRVEKIDFKGNIHLIAHRPTRTNMILVKKGDLLISGINVEKGALGVYKNNEDALATIHYSSYTYNPERINIYFMKWFLKSSVFKRTLHAQARNGIKSELKPKQFLSLEIPLPPLVEQEEIAAQIDSIYSEIEVLGRIAEESKKQLNDLRRSYLLEAVQGKLTEKWRAQNQKVETASKILEKIYKSKSQLNSVVKIKKDEHSSTKTQNLPFEIPKTWTWCKLDEIIQKKPRNGFSPKSVDFVTKTKSLKLSATTKGVFDHTAVKYLEVDIPSDSYLWLEDGDILIQRSNSIDYVGVSAVYRGNNNEFIYPDLMIKIHALKPIIAEYIHFILNSPFVRSYYRDQASGTSGSMPKINQKIVSNTLIPLAPIAEQKKICELLLFLNEKTNLLEQQILQFRNIDQLTEVIVDDFFGEVSIYRTPQTKESPKTSSKQAVKPNNITTEMELKALLKIHGKLHAEALWSMSKFYGPKEEDRKIDDFYAEIKKLVEEEKTIKEVKGEKGYLELS